MINIQRLWSWVVFLMLLIVAVGITSLYTRPLFSAVDYYPLHLAKDDKPLELGVQIKHDNSTCLSAENVYYLKVHKAASSTITTLLYRRTWKRGLNLIPISQDPWPGNKLSKNIMASPGSKVPINTYAEHAIFDWLDVKKVMPKDTYYIGSIRYPLSHLRSTFAEFKLAGKMKINSPDPVRTFLNDIPRYQHIEKLYTKSQQMRTFGMPAEFLDNRTKIQNYIDKLDEHFTIILISEYLDESLVLMRRMLCWDTEDIVFLLQRQREYKHKSSFAESSLVNKHRQYSIADYMLYNHFLYRLVQRMAFERDFSDELYQYKSINAQVAAFCEPLISALRANPKVIYAKLKENRSISFDPLPWGKPFKVTNFDCALMRIDTVILRNIFKVREMPELCSSSKIKRKWKDGHLWMDIKWTGPSSIYIHRMYCSKFDPRFNFPIDILSLPTAYMWI